MGEALESDQIQILPPSLSKHVTRGKSSKSFELQFFRKTTPYFAELVGELNKVVYLKSSV